MFRPMILTTALMLLFVSLAPAATADDDDAAPIATCGFDLWTWYAEARCSVNGMSAGGDAYWCPFDNDPNIECLHSHFVGCTVPVPGRIVCW